VTDDPATTDDPMMTDDATTGSDETAGDTTAAGDNKTTSDTVAAADDETTSDTVAAGDGVAKRVVVTGTPGTGKTAATEQLESGIDAEVIHLNDEIREHDLYTDRDADRDSLVTDLDAARDHLGEWHGVLESHLAHHFDADRVVVLRCEPSALADRLESQGESTATASENAESEALDVVLSEAVDRHGQESIYEIDTTDRKPAAVADEIRAVRDGDREPTAGTVDFTGYLVG